MYKDHNFFDQWANTIYSGMVCLLGSEGYYRISQYYQTCGLQVFSRKSSLLLSAYYLSDPERLSEIWR